MENREDTKSESAKNTESKENEKGKVLEGSGTIIVRDLRVLGRFGFICEGRAGFFNWRRRRERGF